MDTSACTLVTGGTGVVGGAIVRRLLDGGRRVFLTYNSASRTVEELRAHAGTSPGELYATAVDLRAFDTGTLIDLIEDQSGQVDALVHAAAVVDHTRFTSLSPDKFAEVLAVNVVAAYALAREAAQRGTLRDVVLFSSIASSIADLGSAAYTTSKGAVDALTRALAVELSPSVRVNAVAPGIVRSYRTTNDPLFSGPFARVPDAALVDADDVAVVVEHLLDGHPRSLHGQVLTIDGGVSLRRLG